MKTNHPPMKMSDPRFRARIKEVQVALGFSGRDVDGKIGHSTLSRIEALIADAESDITHNDAVGGAGDSAAGDSAASQGGPVSPADSGGASDSAGGEVDDRSAKNIATLHKGVRGVFERITVEGTRIARSMGADSYVMISGTRTYAEQNALYARGRTAPGSRVTNARGGYSNHNFGIAGDFGVFAGGKYLDSSNPALASRVHNAVAKWVKANIPKVEWGGDWKSFRDEPHYQYRTGLSLSQMRARVAAGQSVV